MSDSMNNTINKDELSGEIEKGIHAAKSYLGSAVLTLLLYYVGFFIIGLICNLVFISKSNESKRITGSNPSGRGCLFVLLWVHLILPILAVILLFVLGGFAVICGY